MARDARGDALAGVACSDERLSPRGRCCVCRRGFLGRKRRPLLGEVLRDFSLAMVVGVAFGTYSSVYVASGLALDTWIWLDRRKGIQAE